MRRDVPPATPRRGRAEPDDSPAGPVHRAAEHPPDVHQRGRRRGGGREDRPQHVPGLRRAAGRRDRVRDARTHGHRRGSPAQEAPVRSDQPDRADHLRGVGEAGQEDRDGPPEVPPRAGDGQGGHDGHVASVPRRRVRDDAPSRCRGGQVPRRPHGERGDGDHPQGPAAELGGEGSPATYARPLHPLASSRRPDGRAEDHDGRLVRDVPETGRCVPAEGGVLQPVERPQEGGRHHRLRGLGAVHHRPGVADRLPPPAHGDAQLAGPDFRLLGPPGYERPDRSPERHRQEHRAAGPGVQLRRHPSEDAVLQGAPEAVSPAQVRRGRGEQGEANGHPVDDLRDGRCRPAHRCGIGGWPARRPTTPATVARSQSFVAFPTLVSG